VQKSVIETIEEYKLLFFYEKEQKKILFDNCKLKDTDEKEFKKFLATYTKPLIDDLIKLFKTQGAMDSESLGLALQIVYQDFLQIH